MKVAWSCPTFWYPHRLYSPWNSPDQNPGVGTCSLPQGIFPTQGSNPGLEHCRRILYQLSHQGSPNVIKVCPKYYVVYAYMLKKKKKKTNNILSWNSDLTSMPGFNVGSLNTMSFFNLKRRMLIKKLIKNIYTHTHMHGHIHTYANKGLIDKFANLILLN